VFTRFLIIINHHEFIGLEEYSLLHTMLQNVLGIPVIIFNEIINVLSGSVKNIRFR
jgi:hypothetical protein